MEVGALKPQKIMPMFKTEISIYPCNWSVTGFIVEFFSLSNIVWRQMFLGYLIISLAASVHKIFLFLTILVVTSDNKIFLFLIILVGGSVHKVTYFSIVVWPKVSIRYFYLTILVSASVFRLLTILVFIKIILSRPFLTKDIPTLTSCKDAIRERNSRKAIIRTPE